MRRFDSEDNATNSNTDIDIPDLGIIDPTHDVRLSFCGFPANPGSGAAMPDLGFSYGVFADDNFPHAIESGFFYIDDEDSHNVNYWVNGQGVVSSFGADWGFYGSSGGANTTMKVARTH